jgi:hypothetical protein
VALVGQTDMPHEGDELHHFGWNGPAFDLPSATDVEGFRI